MKDMDENSIEKRFLVHSVSLHSSNQGLSTLPNIMSKKSSEMLFILSMQHDFFFGIRSAKLKKKIFIGRDVNNHIDLERAKKDY